jgi:hypothetical protein
MNGHIFRTLFRWLLVAGCWLADEWRMTMLPVEPRGSVHAFALRYDDQQPRTKTNCWAQRDATNLEAGAQTTNTMETSRRTVRLAVQPDARDTDFSGWNGKLDCTGWEESR